MLSGWARSLSVSPRLFPTTYGNESLPSGGLGLDSPNFGPTSLGGGSYRGLSGSPVLAPVRRESQLTVGTGLSPELGPTRVGSRNNSAGGAGGGLMMASGVGVGGDYSYASFSSQYQDSPPSESLHNHHHSPHEAAPPPSRPASLHSLSQSPALPSHTTHSFSNLDNLASLSPQPLPPSITTASPLPPPASSAPTTPAPPLIPAPTPTLTQPHPPPPPPLPAPPAPTAEEEDPRIRAYAKLEFPTFDIYIQKLSVIIGRRPAAALLAAAANVQQAKRSPSAPSMGMGRERGASTPVGAGGSTPNATLPPLNDARGEGVKLEDFVMGMELDEPQAKEAEAVEKQIKAEPGLVEATSAVLPPLPQSSAMVPQLSLTPSSPKGTTTTTATAPMEAEPVTVDAFAEFLKSSPPPPPPTAAPPTAEADVPPLSLPPSTSSAPPPPPAPAAAAAAPPPGFLTDIDLGPIRAVSRQHARLYFDYEIGGWAIEVLGRNGVVVDGKWKAKGEKEGMGAR